MKSLLRFGLRLLSAVAPGAAANIAARLWFAIPRPRITKEARQFLETGTRFVVAVNGTQVVGWRWGADTGAAVLLMHGWGGYAAQLHAFVQPLTRAGFRVLAFDAPSHGASGPSKLGARHATLFDFADALIAASRDSTELAGIIAHSGGSAAAAWALSGHPTWRVKRMVFIAPFGSPARYMRLFQRALGLSEAAMNRFRANTERQFNFRWADLEVPAIAERVSTPPLLVIHDRDDRETAWEDGAEIAARWPHATLQTTTGLGHNRILRDPVTVDAAVRFVSSSAT